MVGIEIIGRLGRIMRMETLKRMGRIGRMGTTARIKRIGAVVTITLFSLSVHFISQHVLHDWLRMPLNRTAPMDS